MCVVVQNLNQTQAKTWSKILERDKKECCCQAQRAGHSRTRARMYVYECVREKAREDVW